MLKLNSLLNKTDPPALNTVKVNEYNEYNEYNAHSVILIVFKCSDKIISSGFNTITLRSDWLGQAALAGTRWR